MFDGSLPEIADSAALSDAALVDAAGGWARAENAACARKLAAMAEIFARRTGLAAGERELWWVDPQAAVAAEMAAAVNVSQGMAMHQTHRGVALRDRLPAVAALFEAGVVSDLLVHTIVWRTAAWELDILRARYVVGDVFAQRRRGSCGKFLSQRFFEGSDNSCIRYAVSTAARKPLLTPWFGRPLLDQGTSTRR